MKNDSLRIGLIGTFGRGKLAWSAHKPEEGVEIIAGADVVPESLDIFREKVNPAADVTLDYREMLDRDDIDAVFITSPDFVHEEQAIAACQAGKHVYLEKPMAITIEGCDRILRAARDAGVKLYLGHNMRHFPMIRRMKKVIDTGVIGEPKTAWCRHFVSYGGDAYYKDWHADRTKSTGLLLQKAAHDIDVIHWLCSAYTRRVSAMGSLMVYGDITDRQPADKPWHRTHGFVKENCPPLAQKSLYPTVDVEDVSMMHMQLDNGMLASYQQCHFTPDSVRNYTVIGTEGRLENFGDHGQCTLKIWNTRHDAYVDKGDIEHHLTPGTGSHGGSDPNIVAEFIRYVREGGKISTSAVAARNSVAAGYCATQSLRNGSMPVDIPPLDPDLAEYFDKDVMKTID
jgi:predicted dehydrogenase